MKNLQVFYKCPSCSAGYHLDDIKFLGKVDSHCFMQLSCHECSLPVLATVFLSDGEVVGDFQPSHRMTQRSARTKSDLKPREKARFAAMDPISSSEIADFHLYISAYSGNLTKKRSSSRRKANDQTS